MLGWSLKLFRVRGIQIAIHGSFFLLLAWLAWEGWTEDGWNGLLWSVAVLLAFFTCVVLHELGHSFTAQHYGIGVSRILLLPIGGMAQFERIPREPRHEILITLAGPAVNFVIAAGLWIFLPFGPEWSDTIGTYTATGFVYQLFAWNLVMGTFNLLPAFPMDGGRILRALLASRTNYLRATWWAASIGKGVCVLCVSLLVCLWLLSPRFLLKKATADCAVCSCRSYCSPLFSRWENWNCERCGAWSESKVNGVKA